MRKKELERWVAALQEEVGLLRKGVEKLTEQKVDKPTVKILWHDAKGKAHEETLYRTDPPPTIRRNRFEQPADGYWGAVYRDSFLRTYELTDIKVNGAHFYQQAEAG